jgi:hypothetical protein
MKQRDWKVMEAYSRQEKGVKYRGGEWKVIEEVR